MPFLNKFVCSVDAELYMLVLVVLIRSGEAITESRGHHICPLQTNRSLIVQQCQIGSFSVARHLSKMGSSDPFHLCICASLFRIRCSIVLLVLLNAAAERALDRAKVLVPVVVNTVCENIVL